eukprot:9663149-Alexandrium_andersonii.AAC.1
MGASEARLRGWASTQEPRVGRREVPFPTDQEKPLPRGEGQEKHGPRAATVLRTRRASCKSARR